MRGRLRAFPQPLLKIIIEGTGGKRDPESIDGFLVIGGDLVMQTEIHDTYEDPRKALSDHKGISALLG